MLSKVSGVTAAITAVLNAVVLLGWWDLSVDQVTGVTIAIVAVGTVVHGYFNPAVPVGVKKKPTG